MKTNTNILKHKIVFCKVILSIKSSVMLWWVVVWQGNSVTPQKTWISSNTAVRTWNIATNIQLSSIIYIQGPTESPNTQLTQRHSVDEAINAKSRSPDQILLTTIFRVSHSYIPYFE